MHELGHAIGFVHSDLIGVGGTTPSLIAGTPERDAQSIMNSGGAPNRQQSWEANGGFSSNDRLALQRLYPENLAAERVYDYNFYVYLYPDMHNSFSNNPAGASNHWLNYGINEGRVAAPIFDVNYYRSVHSDLAGSDARGAIFHWLEHGTNEGRKSSPAFDVKYYLANNSDVRATVGTTGYQKAYDHWISVGISQGRASSPSYNGRAYLEKNPDLQISFGTNYVAALYHWLRYGRFENRQATY